MNESQSTRERADRTARRNFVLMAILATLFWAGLVAAAFVFMD